jgi:hypothetical protein
VSFVINEKKASAPLPEALYAQELQHPVAVPP